MSVSYTHLDVYKRQDEEQHAVHGYGWYASYAELMNQVAGWAERLSGEGRFGETCLLYTSRCV